MIPTQKIQIKTKKSLIFQADLEKQSDTYFTCKLTAVYPGRQPPTDVSYDFDSNNPNFSEGNNAKDVFQALIKRFLQSLSNRDNTDSISEINNLCNPELISKEEQQEIVNNIVDKPIPILVNGK